MPYNSLSFALKIGRTMNIGFNETFFITRYWPAHPDDPQRIRVASVIEFSVLCSLSVLCLFSSNVLILLQYKAAVVRAVISIRYGTEEGVQGSLLVPQYIPP